MFDFLYIIAAIYVLQFIFLIFQAVGAKIFGARIEEIAYFTGPTLLSFDVGTIKLRLNAIPFGGFVRFGDDFEKLSPLKRILTASIGLLAYLVVAIIGVGFSDVFRQIFSAYGQLFGGAVSPVSVGSKLIESLAVILKEKSFLIGLGILSAKYFALNILPFGTMPAGNIFLYLLEAVGFKSAKFNETFNLIGLLLALAINFLWFIALVVFVWRGFNV